MEKELESKIHYSGVFQPMWGYFGYPWVPSTMKIGEKIFSKDSLMFFDSYPKENKMVFFFKDTEKKGQSEVL